MLRRMRITASLRSCAAGLVLVSGPAGRLSAEDAPPIGEFASAGGARAAAVEGAVEQWVSYQVRVTGGDPLIRVMFTDFIETFREEFRGQLYDLRTNKPEVFERRVRNPAERKRWDLPVEVALWGTPRDVHVGGAVRTTVELRPDQSFLIRMDVKLHDRFDEAGFRRELTRAFLIEQMVVPFVKSPEALRAESVAPPEWLVEGFDNLIAHRRRGSPSSYYRGFFEKGQILKPDQLFEVADPGSLDPVSREIYRASASAFVEVLLAQEEGDAGLRGLLGDLLVTPPRPLDSLLRQHFPAFRELDQGLEKWWALEMVALSQQQSFEYLGWQETERLLDEAIALRFEATPVAVPVEEKGKGKRGLRELLGGRTTAPPEAREAFSGTIADYDRYLSRPGAKAALQVVSDRLQTLKRGGFPLHRPVFAAYERCIARLVKGDTGELAAEFAAIAEMRSKIVETLTRTGDVMNHFEAARVPQRSGAFDDFLQTRRLQQERPRPVRNDAISRHLDALESEFR